MKLRGSLLSIHEVYVYCSTGNYVVPDVEPRILAYKAYINLFKLSLWLISSPLFELFFHSLRNFSHFCLSIHIIFCSSNFLPMSILNIKLIYIHNQRPDSSPISVIILENTCVKISNEFLHRNPNPGSFLYLYNTTIHLLQWHIGHHCIRPHNTNIHLLQNRTMWICAKISGAREIM